MKILSNHAIFRLKTSAWKIFNREWEQNRKKLPSIKQEEKKLTKELRPT
jgi:hypothetical protein